jgi:hypothetical protein
MHEDVWLAQLKAEVVSLGKKLQHEKKKRPQESSRKEKRRPHSTCGLAEKYHQKGIECCQQL